MSNFTAFVQKSYETPAVYYSWSKDKFDKNSNTFNLKFKSGQDRLSIITATESLLNYFSCPVEHFKEISEDLGLIYYLKYKGNFEQP